MLNTRKFSNSGFFKSRSAGQRYWTNRATVKTEHTDKLQDLQYKQPVPKASSQIQLTQLTSKKLYKHAPGDTCNTVLRLPDANVKETRKHVQFNQVQSNSQNMYMKTSQRSPSSQSLLQERSKIRKYIYNAKKTLRHPKHRALVSDTKQYGLNRKSATDEITPHKNLGINFALKESQLNYDYEQLHNAAHQGQSNRIKQLVSAGVNIYALDRSHRSILHIAAIKGHNEIVAYCLDNGFNIDAYDKTGQTPLHYSISNCNAICLRQLMSAGANLNIRDKKGNKPIHAAAMQNSLKLFIYMVLKGANPNNVGQFNETALEMVLRTQRQMKGTKQLKMKTLVKIQKNMENNKSISIKISYGDILRSLQFAQRYGGKLNHRALACAIKMQRTSCIKGLAALDVNINKQSSDGKTGLHVAAQLGLTKSLHCLLQLGADPNLQTNTGQTALMLAIQNQQYRASRILLQYNTHLEVQDSQGLSALHYALNSNSGLLVEKLFSTGAFSINAKEHGPLPLQYAIAQSKPEMIKLLISRGASLHCLDDSLGALSLHTFSSDRNNNCEIWQSIQEAVIYGERKANCNPKSSIDIHIRNLNFVLCNWKAEQLISTTVT